MDEKTIQNPDTPQTRETLPLSWRDWAGPLAALVMAALWFSVFGLGHLAGYNYMPGVSVTVLVAVHFAAVLLFRRRGRPLDRAGLGLMAAALVLAVCVGLYAAWLTALVNYGLIFFVSAAATFRLSGHSRLAWDDDRAFFETLSLTFRALTRYPGRVFTAAGLAFRKPDRRGGGLWLGVLIAVPLLALVLALLASADEVFGGLFAGLRRELARLDPALSLYRAARTLTRLTPYSLHSAFSEGILSPIFHSLLTILFKRFS